MTKRVMSMFLTVCMLLSILPSAAFAVEETSEPLAAGVAAGVLDEAVEPQTPDTAAETGEEGETVVVLPTTGTEVVDSGYCGGEGDGTNLTWTLTTDGILTISGNGEMKDYYADSETNTTSAPWGNWYGSIESVIIDQGVTGLGESAFLGCGNFSEVAIPDSVTRIGGWAFMDCAGLTAVKIPSGVSEINDYVFAGCTGLTTVTIPDGVRVVLGSAFQGCSSLTDVVFASSVEGICFYSPFTDCPNLTRVEFLGDAPYTFGTGYELEEKYIFEDCDKVTVYYHEGTVGWPTDGVWQKRPLVMIEGEEPDREVIASGYCGGEGDETNLTWTLTTDGTLTISGTGEMMESPRWQCWGDYSKAIMKIQIEQGVTGISDGSFSGCTNLTEVTIPNSVTVIGGHAFEGCYALKSISLPDGLTTIGYAAFNCCTGLTEVTIPRSVTAIGDSAFTRCTAMTAINVDEDNTVYQSVNGVLFDKAGTTLIQYPSGKSGAYAIPNGVTTIGNSAFDDHDGLTSVTIPESVTEVGEIGFASCNNLTEIVVDADNSVYRSIHGVLYSEDGTVLVAYPGGAASFVIPDGVTEIGAFAFYNCDGLTRITIPTSVTTIGRYAFGDCYGLTSVTIPGSVTEICDYAFSNSNLTSVTIEDGVKTIGAYGFGYCWDLTSVTIPDSVFSFGHGAFYGCSDDLVIYGYTGSIAESYAQTNDIAFSSLGGGADVITASGTCGGEGDGTNLTWTLTAGGTLTISGNGAMADYDWQYGVPWYHYCEDMTAVVVEDGVTTIGNYAFYFCSELTSVVIPASVTTIGSEVCESLTDVFYIGDETGWNAITISDWNSALNDAPRHYIAADDLVNLTLTSCRNGTIDVCQTAVKGYPVAIIVTPDSGYRFKHLVVDGVVMEDNLNSFTVTGNHDVSAVFEEIRNFVAEGSCGKYVRWYLTQDGTLTVYGVGAMSNYSLSEGTTTAPWGTYISSIKTLIVRNNVTTIGDCAFYDCSALASVRIPNSVTTIGIDAFYGVPAVMDSGDYGGPAWVLYSDGTLSITGFGAMGGYYPPWDSHRSSIKAVIIGDNVTTINDYAFDACSGLTSVAIPDSVTVIGGHAFDGCSGMTSVTIGNNVTDIGLSAFENCSSLKSVTIPSSVTFIGPYAFRSCSGLTSAVIPESVTTIRWQAFSYCSSLTSVTIPNGVTAIEEETFYGCSSLASVVIPDSVTTIGYEAFSQCESLTNVTIPDGVTTIGDEAFYRCRGLASVTIPAGVTSIGEDTFYGCSDNLVIYGYAGSYAQTYAEEQGIEFSELAEQPEEPEQPGPAQFPITLTFAEDVYIQGKLACEISVRNASDWSDRTEYSVSLTDTRDLSVSIPLEETTSDTEYYVEVCFTNPDGAKTNLVTEYTYYYTESGLSENSGDRAIMTLPEEPIVLTAHAGCVVRGKLNFPENYYLEDGAELRPEFRFSVGWADAVVEADGSYTAVLPARMSGETVTMYVWLNIVPEGSEYADQLYNARTNLILNKEYAYLDANGEQGTITLSRTQATENVDIDLETGYVLSGTLTVPENAQIDSSQWHNYIYIEGRNAKYGREDEGKYVDDWTWDGQTIALEEGKDTYEYFLIVPADTEVLVSASCEVYGDNLVYGELFYGENGTMTWDRDRAARIKASEDMTGIDLTLQTGFPVTVSIAASPEQTRDYANFKLRWTNADGEFLGEFEEGIGVNDSIESGFMCPDGEELVYLRCCYVWYITQIDDVYDYYYRSVIEGPWLYLNPDGTYSAKLEDAQPWTVGPTAENLIEVTLPEEDEPFQLLGGYCGGEGDGTNLSWNLMSDGTMTISGTGSMENYDSAYEYEDDSSPWSANRGYITKLVVEDGVTSIGDGAFRNCTGLTSVDIPASVTSIGENAFSGATNLARVEFLGDMLSSFGDGIFDGCRSAVLYYHEGTDGWPTTGSLQGRPLIMIADETDKVKYPITKMPAVNGSFSVTSGYNTPCIIVNASEVPWGPENDTYYSANHEHNSSSEIGIVAQRTCTVVLNYGVISEQNCDKLYVLRNGTQLDMISGVVENKVLELDLVAGDAVIVCYAKDGSVNRGDDRGWVSISCDTAGVEVAEAVEGESITIVATPDNGYQLGTVLVNGQAIEGNTFTMPAQAVEVEVTFAVCEREVIASGYCGGKGDGTNLTWTLYEDGELVISGNGTMANYNSDSATPWYSNRDDIQTVTIRDGVTTIGDFAFERCDSLTAVTVGASVINIGRWAFCFCDSLTAVTIGDSVTTIGDYAFYNCKGLTAVTIGDSVTIIGYYAFEDCYSLTTITIPDSVTSIGHGAFSGCSGLTAITIPSNVTTIMETAFSNCSSLIQIKVVEGNTTYCDVDGVLFSKDKTQLLRYPGGKTGSYTIPDSVTTIGNYAFSDCHSLTAVTIPDDMTIIGDGAFSGCASLTSITIPDSVTTIESSAFFDCDNLTTVEIGDSVTTIGNYAFYDCGSLTDVTIPASVTSIGDDVFGGCPVVIYGYAGSYAQTYAQENGYEFCAIGALGNTSVYIKNSKEPHEIISGAKIRITNTATGQVIYSGTTGENGMLQIDLEDGVLYRVLVNATGYQPREGAFKKNEGEDSYTVYMSAESILQVETTVTEMTYDEIVAAGIDPSAPGNQHVYQATTVLDFGGKKYPVSYVCAGDQSTGHRGTGDKVLKGDPIRVGDDFVYPVARDMFLVVPARATWLKEMFDVQLLVTNTSDIEDVENCVASLNLPEGLSLADMIEGTQSATASLGTITPGGSAAHNWYIRGDEKGEYVISGTVTGTRVGGGISEDISEPFTSKPISVLAGEAMKLTIEAEKAATIGQPYNMRFTLKNVSEKTLYNVNFDVLGGTFRQAYTINEVLASYDLEGPFKADVDNSELKNGFSLSAEEFEPGDVLSGVFTITFGEGITDPDAVEYMLKRVFFFTSAGSTTEIPTEVIWVDSISNHTHDYDEGVVTTAPTCTEPGVKTFTCTDSNCGETITVDIPAVGHSMGQWTTIKAATCTENGVAESECTNEGCTYKDTMTPSALGHSYAEEWTTDLEPTCTAEGSKSRHCTRQGCDAKADVTVIPANGHSYGQWEKHNETQHKHTCTVEACKFVEYADHIWSDGVETAAPTHLTEGVKTFTCTEVTCGQTKTEAIDKLPDHIWGAWESIGDTQHKRECPCDEFEIADHTWNEGEETTAPTHLAEGVKTFTCTEVTCGQTKTEAIDKLPDHIWGAWESISDTQHKRECPCDEFEIADHSWNEGEETTAPTHLTEGVKTFTCTEVTCGQTKTEAIDKLPDHIWGDWKKDSDTQHKRECPCNEVETADHGWSGWTQTAAPTCTLAGEERRDCDSCEAYETKPISALGHSWNDGVVTKEPTLDEEGVRTFTCTVCGSTKTEAIAKLQKQDMYFSTNLLNQDMVKTYGDPNFTDMLFNESVEEPVLTYTSSDERVATVDENGWVTIKGAGTAMISATSAAVPYQYVETTASYKLVVNKAELTITVNDAAITYGETFAPKGYVTNGFVYGETADVLSGEAAYSCQYAQYDTVGEYPITVSGLTADNYNITVVPGKLTVNKATSYTISFGNHAQKEGNVTPVTAVTVPQDTSAVIKLEYKVDGQWTATVPTAAGTYPVRAELTGSDNIVLDGHIYGDQLVIEAVDSIGGISVSVKTEDESGNATVEVSDDEVKRIVESLEGTNGDLAMNLESVEKDTLTLPGNLIEELDKSEDLKTVTVTTGNSSISMSDTVLKTMADAMDKEDAVSLQMNPVDVSELDEAQKNALESIGGPSPMTVVLELKLTVTDEQGEVKKEIKNLGDTVDITIQCSQEMANKRVVACYISPDGTVTYLVAKYDEATHSLSFKTNHFSTYAAVALNEDERMVYVVDENGVELSVTGAGPQTVGASVTIQAPAAPSGYRFSGWQVVSGTVTLTNANSASTTFTMPEEDVILKPTYSRRPAVVTGGSGGSMPTTYILTVDKIENGSVTLSGKEASAGDSVTITVKADEGYQLDALTVLDKSGKEVEVTKKSDTEYTFTMPAGKIAVKATFVEVVVERENPFVDVTEEEYYYDAVLWAVENGITGGTSATTFSPAAVCTRAQMIMFLWRVAGSPETATTCPFTDVTPSDYYYNAVAWAVENGITSGTSATTFSPDDTVTRAQSVTFLWRVAKSPAAAKTNHFVDVASDDYYHNAVRWAAETGITAGTSESTFSPENPCLRGQIITFLYRYVKG